MHFMDEVAQKAPGLDIERIKKAWEYASNAHKHQKRLDGRPYIVHPEGVVMILLSFDEEVDTETVMACLLHDVVEDTESTITELKTLFGERTANMVDALTHRKTTQNQAMRDYLYYIRMHRKTKDDPFIILAKTADLLHNLETLWVHKQDRQQEIACNAINHYSKILRDHGYDGIADELIAQANKYC